MFTRLFSTAVVAAWMVFLSPAAVDAAPQKGVGAWEIPGAAKGLRNVRVTWFYSWSLNPTVKRPDGVQFVPMVWDEKTATPAALARVDRRSGILLGFNEPDEKTQANMTVEEAIALWPQLERTGLRLGSPAPAKMADRGEGWLHRFMDQAKARGLRVDFICVHNYQACYNDPKKAARQLVQFLKDVHHRYRRPVWLTEFALADWSAPVKAPRPATAEQQEAFLRTVRPMLDRLPFLERYAWFALPPNPHGDGGALVGSNLCTKSGALTRVGESYR